MSWVKNHRIATRRFSSSTPSRSAHSTCRSAGQLVSVTNSAKYSACRRRDVGTGVAGRQSFGGELPHGHQHAEAWSVVVGDDADEAVAGERVEEVQRLVLACSAATRAAASSVHPSANTDSASTSSRSESLSSPKLHSTVARSVRWRSGRSTGPVPSASRTFSSRANSVTGGSSRVRGRRELDREGQPVEAATDLRDGGGVRVVQREVVADRPRPIHEETHCRQRRELLERRAPGERRDGERLHGVLPLGAEAQHGAARGEDPDVRSMRRGVDRARLPRPSPARGCRGPAASGALAKNSIKVSSAERVPSMGAPTAAATRGSTSAGSVMVARGTNSAWRWCPSSAAPTAIASRVLPIPPGPVSVTSRTSGDSSSDDSSATSASRPISEVDGVGSDWRGGGVAVAAGDDRGSAATAEVGVANRSLRSSARSSRTRRPSSRRCGRIGRNRRPWPGGRRSSPPTEVPAPAPVTSDRAAVACRRRAGTRPPGRRCPCQARSIRSAASTGRRRRRTAPGRRGRAHGAGAAGPRARTSPVSAGAPRSPSPPQPARAPARQASS